MISKKKDFARYLPVNNQARLWELYGIDVGFTDIHAGSVYPPVSTNHPRGYAEKVRTGRILREYQVVYITLGSGWFKNSNVGKIPVKAGDIFIVFPGVLHSYSPLEQTGWQEYWVGFNGEHARRLQKKGLFSPARPIHHIGLDASIANDFNQMITLCQQQPTGFQVTLGARILQLLAHIHVTENNPNLRGREQSLIARVRELMEFHISDNMTAVDIATQLNIGYQSLLRIFKKQTGFTPYQYYLHLRIAKAQELLLHTDLSIKEIAELLNFDNQYYFSRIFRKKQGLPPSLWRNVGEETD